MSRIGAFKKRTIQQLAEATDNYCARCSQKTSYFDSEQNKRIGFGRAAHAVAASPGGPRFDDTYTVEQLKAAENGIHLCANCADLVDKLIDKFTVDDLQQMQVAAEVRARDLVMQGRTSSVLLDPAQSQRIANFTKKARDSIAQLQISKGWAGWEGSWNWHEAEKAISFYRDCCYVNMLHHPLCGGTQDVIDLQISITKNILMLHQQVKSEPWFYISDGHFSKYVISAGQSYGDDKNRINEAGSATSTLLDDTYKLISNLENRTFAGNTRSSLGFPFGRI